jgi:hypothetical protein
MRGRQWDTSETASWEEEGARDGNRYTAIYVFYICVHRERERERDIHKHTLVLYTYIICMFVCMYRNVMAAVLISS